MHVFTRTVSGWVPQAVLTNPTGEQAECFAMSGAAVSGYTVAVSASNYDGDGTTRGVVYVFTRTGSTWDLTATLTSPAPADGARFGQALDLDGDTLVVGEGPPGKARRIHTYQRAGSTWQLAGTIMQPGPNPGLGGVGRPGQDRRVDAGGRGVPGDAHHVRAWSGAPVHLVRVRVGAAGHPAGTRPTTTSGSGST